MASIRADTFNLRFRAHQRSFLTTVLVDYVDAQHYRKKGVRYRGLSYNKRTGDFAGFIEFGSKNWGPLSGRGRPIRIHLPKKMAFAMYLTLLKQGKIQ